MSMKINRLSPRDYPERLGLLHQPPSELYEIGQPISDLLTRPALGIVGSRKVSNYGREVTSRLAADFAGKGGTVISGLALGVDSIAHQAAIEAGGLTIAVLPSSIESIYPASHSGLARQILQKRGSLLSEYSGKMKPQKHQFIERNRLIAALSDALLVTEAAENSGSLHTARFALELGKPVMAVPGNITSPTSAGTNNLIKAGAHPIATPQDIYDVLGVSFDSEKQAELLGDDDIEALILNLINDGTTNAAEILAGSKLAVDQFQQTLTMLEIKGRIRPLGNDNWAISN